MYLFCLFIFLLNGSKYHVFLCEMEKAKYAGWMQKASVARGEMYEILMKDNKNCGCIDYE